MASGLTRVVPAVIEAGHDENGIIWPVSVAPFEVALISLKVGDGDCDAACEKLYDGLKKAGIDVIYDDREQGAGAKFATADLIGFPYQLIVGPRGLKSGEVEIKHRKDGLREPVAIEDALKRLLELIVPARLETI